jgi:DNA-binding response OmpR family regulator
MQSTRILLVDDDERILSVLSTLLHNEGFEVTTAHNVPDAMKLVSANVYDVLISDLHMPGAGDGLTVVGAMRRANPKTVTMLLTGFPEMDAAAEDILLQADQIILKPTNIKMLVQAIKQRLAAGAPAARVVRTAATILESAADRCIADWFEYVQKDEKIMAVPLNYEQRTCHLPQLFRELVHRLRSFKVIGSAQVLSPAAAMHGLNRHRQGYSAAMLVEESRMLQISIFHTLQENLAQVDFSIALTEVKAIADEIDSQLSQAMSGYLEDTAHDLQVA